MSKTHKIITSNVFLQKQIQKGRLTNANFDFIFKTLVKMQKVKSNTFKNINYHIFQNNPKISFMNEQNT